MYRPIIYIEYLINKLHFLDALPRLHFSFFSFYSELFPVLYSTISPHLSSPSSLSCSDYIC